MPNAFTIVVESKNYSFDFVEQIISIDATLDTINVITLWTAIKQAHDHVDGVPWEIIAEGEGLVELEPSIKTYLTVKLYDNWTISSLKASGIVTVRGGNLVRDDGGSPFKDNPLLTYINNLSQAGVLVETGVSGLTPEESVLLSSMASSVWSHILEPGFSASRIARIIAAAVAGKSSGGPGSPVFRSLGDTSDQVSGAADIDGNRTSATYGA